MMTFLFILKGMMRLIIEFLIYCLSKTTIMNTIFITVPKPQILTEIIVQHELFVLHVIENYFISKSSTGLSFVPACAYRTIMTCQKENMLIQSTTK